MIKLENVSKKYGEMYAVKKLNFEIKEGEIVGFLGRNGAGKSTTMNMITGFIESTEGTITVGGYDIDLNAKKAKSLIGYMPEGVPLYMDLTVREFVNYMADLKLIKRKDKKAAVEKAINDTGLEKVKNKLIRNLSRGYKQRVSMAGALVGDPKIIILDEPTVGMDPEQVIEIRNLIKSLGKEHTVILSSHILTEVSQICEKVIIIDKGEILAIDTPDNLEKLRGEQQIKLIVEEKDKTFNDIKSSVEGIKEVVSKEDDENGYKVYSIIVEDKKDIRKDLSIACTSNGMTIIELSRKISTLEDVFIDIIGERPELSTREREEIDKNMELNELRAEAAQRKADKAAKKEAKKEAKKDSEVSKEKNVEKEENK